MNQEEKEFYEMIKSAEAFKAELKALVKKYDIGTWETDQYNGMEEFIGTDIYFTFSGVSDVRQTIDEVIEEILK